MIAIRPLVGCDEKLRKVLVNGEIYTFYSDYKFDLTGDDVTTITYVPTVPANLYDIQREEPPLFVNVSAIVGKNGSGKSTLIELFYLAVYLLSIENDAIEKPRTTKAEGRFDNLKNKLKLEVYYQIDNTLYCLQFGKGQGISFKNILFKEKGQTKEINRERSITYLLEGDTTFDFKKFFYSVSINYSLYGLNSKNVGEWIDSLFHKNDGYRTPLVINPMRDNGNIDVNKEEEFAKVRLLSNILKVNKDGSKEHHNLTESQKVKSIKFSLNRSKVEYAIIFNKGTKNEINVKFEKLYEENGDKEKLIEKVFTVYLGKEVTYASLQKKHRDVQFKEEIEKYIIKKIIQIAITYDDYGDYFKYDHGYVIYPISGKEKVLEDKKPTYKFINFDEYLGLLKKDNTHITYKLRQAINYLKNDTLKSDGSKPITWSLDIDGTTNYCVVNIDTFSKRLNCFMNDELTLLELIPPPLFGIQILLEKIDKKGNEKDVESEFKYLSSGEQQLIHSVQSVLYHLNNINSVFYQPKRKKKRKEYKYVNIVLDEIELYFHPEYQRKFLSRLLKGIKDLEIENICGLNILFATHSPFILSDIPTSNVLYLLKGKSQEVITEQTFGSNIHELLASSFYLEEGFVGDFATRKIEQLIGFYQDKNNCFTEKTSKNIIDLIGDKLIVNRLLEMHDEKFEKKSQVATDKEYETWLESELKRVQLLKHD